MKINMPQATTILKFVAAMCGVIAVCFSTFFFIDARYAHSLEMKTIERQLQLRDNANYLEIQVTVSTYEVNRISDVIKLYEDKLAINVARDSNFKLDAWDQLRLDNLRKDYSQAVLFKDSVVKARNEMLLSITAGSVEINNE